MSIFLHEFVGEAHYDGKISLLLRYELQTRFLSFVFAFDLANKVFATQKVFF